MEKEGCWSTLVWLQVVMIIYLIVIYPVTCWMAFNVGVREGKAVIMEKYESPPRVDTTTFIGPVMK